VLAQLDGSAWLFASLLYGSGLRLMEALRLRVNDLVIERGELIVRDAKGGKDRVTVLPASIVDPLRAHLAKLHIRFEQQRRSGQPGASLPVALARKFPNASRQWGWQYVFPAHALCQDVYTGLLNSVSLRGRRSSSSSHFPLSLLFRDSPSAVILSASWFFPLIPASYRVRITIVRYPVLQFLQHGAGFARRLCHRAVRGSALDGSR